MSSSNASADLIASLKNASNLVNQYPPIFIFIFGIIGNLLNILVLSQRSLRSNPSAVFFLASSLAGIIVIISGLISRMMSGYGLDLTLTIDWICKIRNVVLYSSRTILLWMIVLATIDRWLSSSVNVTLRQMSTLKNVRRSMFVVLIYTCLINAPILYCYEAGLTGLLRGCYGSTLACRLTTDLIYAFGSTLLPLSLMIIFGLLTIRNVRHVQSRVRIVPTLVFSLETNNEPMRPNEQSRARKTDRQLFKMLLVQVILLFLLTGPHAGLKAYSSFVPVPASDLLETVIQTLLLNVFTLLAFIASGMPFYIYTLTGGSLFRKALLDVVKTIIQKFLCCSCF
jgi:hypothetical protein